MPLLLLIFLTIPSVAFAANNSSQTVPENKVYVGQILLEDQEYPLDNYQVETQDNGGLLSNFSLNTAGDNALEKINTGLWSVNKQIANFAIYAVSELLSFNLINQIADQTAQISNNVFNGMSGLFLPIFVIIAGGIAAYRFFVNRQESSAVKSIIGTLLDYEFNLLVLFKHKSKHPID